MDNNTYTMDAKSWARSWARALSDHPELVELVIAWPNLPEPMRAGIMAMIEAAKPAAPAAPATTDKLE